MTSKHLETGRVAVASWVMAVLCIFASPSVMGQFTFTINSLADDGLQVPDDIICVTAASECTFRAAIQAANNRSDIVIIEFNPDLPTDALGRSIIFPQSPLPAITQTVVIQGQSHSEFDENDNLPRFLISGAAAGTSASGLRFEGGSEGSQMRHLAIYDFMLSGVTLAGVDEITLEDNHIGLRPLSFGTSEPAGNAGSGLVLTGSSNNTIEANWIGANASDGLFLASGSTDNLVIGNRIGQRPVSGGTGVDDAGNLGSGVQIASSAGNGNQVGQCSGFPNEICRGNVIAANAGVGIHLAADDQHVQGNWIGTTPEDPDNADYGNGEHGMQVDSGNNVIIGGLTQLQRIQHNAGSGIMLTSGVNEISGNLVLDNDTHGLLVVAGGQDIINNIIGGHEWGIAMSHPADATPDGLVRILGNRIGVSMDDEPIPNNWGIVNWEGGFSRIGDANQGNVIGFNTSGGMAFNEAEASWIQANWIGILPDGGPAGNNGPGINVTVLSDSGSGGTKRIGYTADATIPDEPVGTTEALGNIIAYNADGVLISSNQSNFNLDNNPVRGNRFFANSGQAINLGPDGDTVDPGGAAEGPNRLQNFPVFETTETFFNGNSGEIEFNYTVNTTSANASYPLRIDFYLADGSSSQGRIFLHTDEYTGAFAAQPRSGSFMLPAGVDPQDAYLVATATDDAGNTSQFSAAVSLAESGDSIFQDRFEQD